MFRDKKNKNKKEQRCGSLQEDGNGETNGLFSTNYIHRSQRDHQNSFFRTQNELNMLSPKSDTKWKVLTTFQKKKYGWF